MYKSLTQNKMKYDIISVNQNNRYHKVPKPYSNEAPSPF